MSCRRNVILRGKTTQILMVGWFCIRFARNELLLHYHILTIILNCLHFPPFISQSLGSTIYYRKEVEFYCTDLNENCISFTLKIKVIEVWYDKSNQHIDHILKNIFISSNLMIGSSVQSYNVVITTRYKLSHKLYTIWRKQF